MTTYAGEDDVTVEQEDVQGNTEGESHVTSPGVKGDVHHRESHGGDLVPGTPMGLPLIIAVFVCSLTSVLSGLAVICIGSYMAYIYATQSTISPAVLWWAGLLPLLMGWLGLYTAFKKNRKYLLHWGIWSFVVAVFVTVVMFCAGNFYAGDYATWKMSDQSNKPLCRQKSSQERNVCCCPRSTETMTWNPMSSPRKNNTLCEELSDTGLFDCDTVYLLSRLYIAVMASYAAYTLASIASMVFGYGGSVCATPDTESFHHLEEETVEDDTVEGTCASSTPEVYSVSTGKELTDMRSSSSASEEYNC